MSESRATGAFVETETDAGGTADPVREAFLLFRAPSGVFVRPLAEGDALTIGRSPDSDVVVDDTRISRAHARFALRDSKLIVEDLGSRNGVYVDGAHVKSGMLELAAGQLVRIGPLEVSVARSPTLPEGEGDVATRAVGAELDALIEAEGLVAADPPTLHALGIARRVARTDATVLITGETGSGKEVFAALIHRASKRANAPYVRLNCAALPPQLLEAELFGHERGAFTGADRRRTGYFEAAAGGTLLLDEIGEMPLDLQAKLLRVLEDRSVTRLGSTEPIAVDVRVIAATHRDLSDAVAAGTFRADLYYRVAAFTLSVPPLRERKTEIVLLAERFARRVSSRRSESGVLLRPDAVLALVAYAFPGNVRELKNAIEFASVMAEGGAIGVEHLPPALRGGAPKSHSNAPPPVKERLESMEKVAIENALRETKGNRTHAAHRLGMSRRGLLYKMDKYGLR